MSTTYDGALGTTVTVRPVGSSVTVGFDDTLVLVGPDDSGSASHHDAIAIEDRNEADNEFGSGSELAKGFTAARDNGASDIYCVAVDSTASPPDYTSAAQAAMTVGPRYICALTTTDSEISEVRSEVTNYETDLEFTRLFAPGKDTSTGSISGYSPRDNDVRYIEVSPASCDNTKGESTFTAAAVAGRAVRKPLGSSLAFDDITVNSLGVDYRPSQATDFDKVTAVTKDELIVDGVTTSSKSAFSDIFQMEIVDTVALGLDEVAQDYAGTSPNTEDDRDALAGDARVYLESLADQNPPLLADASGGDPYAVSVSLGSNETEVDLKVGVEPVDVMKQINIDMDVGDVTRFNGLST